MGRKTPNPLRTSSTSLPAKISHCLWQKLKTLHWRCVCVCACACVRACVRACVCVCACAILSDTIPQYVLLLCNTLGTPLDSKHIQIGESLFPIHIPLPHTHSNTCTPGSYEEGVRMQSKLSKWQTAVLGWLALIGAMCA